MDVAHSLLAQEVTDLHLLSLLVDGHVDGEVSVHKTHLVAVTVSHTEHHVLDVGADGAHHSHVLVQTEPELHDDLALLLADVHELVGEVTAQRTAGSLHHNASVLDVDVHYSVNAASLKTYLLRGFRRDWKQE